MSRRQENTILRVAFGKDPLDDPLNAVWDAVVLHDRPSSSDIDLDDLAVLRRVHALDAESLPSPAFFGDLEQQLVALYSPRVVSSDGPPSPAVPRIGIAQPVQKRPASPPPFHRLFSMQGALAVLAAIMAASLIVLYQAVPRSSEPPVIPAAIIVEPTMETMFQFDFDPPLLGMPDATTWDHMDFNLFQLDPGTSFSTDVDWYTVVDGPLMIMVASGQLTIIPAGPALYYPADRRGRAPAEIPAGQTVSLGPNDAIVYATVDSATGSNPGSEPAVAVLGSVGQLGTLSLGADAGPLDIKNLDRHYDDGLDALSTAGASISIRRLHLAPFDSFIFSPDMGWRYLCVFDQFQMTSMRLADGAIDGLSPDVDWQRLYTSTQLTYPGTGPHTIFNLGAETVDIYFLVVEAATPP